MDEFLTVDLVNLTPLQELLHLLRIEEVQLIRLEIKGVCHHNVSRLCFFEIFRHFVVKTLQLLLKGHN